MLTKLEQLLLKQYEEKFGKLTSSEAFELACCNEQIKKELPLDIALPYFAEQERIMLNYAILLEKNS